MFIWQNSLVQKTKDCISWDVATRKTISLRRPLYHWNSAVSSWIRATLFDTCLGCLLHQHSVICESLILLLLFLNSLTTVSFENNCIALSSSRGFSSYEFTWYTTIWTKCANINTRSKNSVASISKSGQLNFYNLIILKTTPRNRNF